MISIDEAYKNTDKIDHIPKEAVPPEEYLRLRYSTLEPGHGPVPTFWELVNTERTGARVVDGQVALCIMLRGWERYLFSLISSDSEELAVEAGLEICQDLLEEYEK